jgi:hypothetical protein
MISGIHQGRGLATLILFVLGLPKAPILLRKRGFLFCGKKED